MSFLKRILLVAPDLNFARSQSAKKPRVPLWVKPILRIAGIKYFGEKPQALFPPLGLITVAGLTPKKYEVSLVDESVEEINFDFQADLVGITCNSSTSYRAYQIADIFRDKEKK